MDNSYYIPKVENTFLSLEKPIVFFDLETTGTSTSKDRIVELCAIKLAPNGTREELHHLFNPTVPISAGATAVHGYTDEMVKDKPTFEDLAIELADFFQDCDLGGYNINRFDVPMLMQEFHRCKKYPIKVSEVKLVDSMSIFHSKEKRDLSAAVKFYCQREHEGAHSAKADILATIDILKHQLLKYEDLKANTSFLHDYSNSGSIVDPSGKFKRDENGTIVFNFGKHKGKEACTEADYLKWMLNEGDFTIDTIMVARRIYKNCIWESEIKQWLQTNKILQNSAMASALYTAVKFEKDVFPFAINKQSGKMIVTYVPEPTSSYTLAHQDAVETLLNILDGHLSKQEAT